MKRHVLFLACTHFQLMTAIQIRRSFFGDDSADIIVTDYGKRCAAIADRLRCSGEYDRVCFVQDWENEEYQRLQIKIRLNLKALLFPKHTLDQCAVLREQYDLFLFNTPCLLARLIVRRYGAGMECRLFEEGYGSYTEPFQKKKRLRGMLIRGFFGDLEKKLTGKYLYHPELYTKAPGSKLYQIPLFDRDDRELWNYIFDYSPDTTLLEAEYIFFDEMFSERFEGETELLEAVAEVVGRENLAIKQHPRSRRGDLSPDGFRTAERAELPWELTEMNERIEGKTLLTVSSGSAFAPALYFNDRVKVFLLFRCVKVKGDEAYPGKRYLDYVDRLTKDRNNYYTPANIQELVQLLKEQRSQGGTCN